jgi:hypothetical protein
MLIAQDDTGSPIGSRVKKLRRDFQAVEKGADPREESGGPHSDIQAALESVVNCRQRQRSTESAVKRGSQKTAESDEGCGAAESEASDDEDEAEAEHDPPTSCPTI